MASIILSAATSAVGGGAGVPGFNFFASRLTGAITSRIQSSLFSSNRQLRPLSGPRLADLGVQTSTYGKVIPIVYGTVRIGGNVIWSRPIREVSTTSTSSASAGGKGGGGKVTQSATTYSYYVTIAVAICEGPVDDVHRIWADAKQIDLSQHTVRIYKGGEDQLPDTLIQSYEGAANTPAYRGIAYAVFEDFPLADYGNRIPNFTFEVRRKALYPDYDGEVLEDMIEGMVMIPGAGEFVYDTQVEYKIPGTQVGSQWVQQGNREVINQHNPAGKTDALLSLDQLQRTCANVEWVSVVVGWFGDSLDAGSCVIKPGVEYQEGATTGPDVWQSAGFTRATARQITFSGGVPQYGGTPDDSALLRYLDELRSRGYKILFYPLVFMDISGKPWRGELTGSAADVAGIFTRTNGYNAFINHYANLVASRVDAFCIGSELVGLTKVTDTPGNYPAVNQLVSLAESVKSIVGSGVKVTYAADWSEYHHADGGWYHMDTLWASPDIDVIGIDAYFPIKDSSNNTYDIDTLIEGWDSGEGYDYYYTDPARTTQASLSPAYAWKNIEWFWSNAHTNPGGGTTAWVPESKKIWFTEYGFPSVDNAANQPNVFFDPGSSASALPYFSKGRVDFMAQRAGHVATQQRWKGSAMVERMFAWTWDARPYPYWPDLTQVWSDGAAWKTGHWVQGKFGVSSLAAIVADLCLRSGLEAVDIDVDAIAQQVDGYVIHQQQSVRSAVETLQLAYFFDAVESDHKLKFVPRGGAPAASIAESDMIPSEGQSDHELLSVVRTQEIELPRRITLVYLNRLLNYQSSAQSSQREITSSREVAVIDLPLVLSDQVARNIADVALFTDWMGRTGYELHVPLKYMRLEPADVITATASGITHRLRITSTQMLGANLMKISGVAEDSSTYEFYSTPGAGTTLTADRAALPDTRLELLDIPAFPSDDPDKPVLRYGAVGLNENWTGAAIYRSDDNGANYNRLGDASAAAIIGTASDALPVGPYCVFDEANTLTVVLTANATLQSVSELAVLNGANAALLGEEILQFKNAVLLEPGKYRLSGLLRGRLGTEWAIDGHAAGERFVLLDASVGRQVMALSLVGQSRDYKAVTFGASLASAEAIAFTHGGVGLKPYSPVHIAGVRDGGGNLAISWIRRTRLGGGWSDAVDVPLSEATESYDVEIMSGSSVVRSFNTLASPGVTYGAAEQTADFGAPQSSVDIKVYQRSALVGRGYAAEATL